MNASPIERLRSILTSRKFYTSLAGILLVVFGFELTPELQAALLTGVTSVFLVFDGIEKTMDKFNMAEGSVPEKFGRYLVSPEFLAFVATSVYMLFGVELSDEFAASIIAVVTSVASVATAIRTGLIGRG